MVSFIKRKPNLIKVEINHRVFHRFCQRIIRENVGLFQQVVKHRIDKFLNTCDLLKWTKRVQMTKHSLTSNEAKAVMKNFTTRIFLEQIDSLPNSTNPPENWLQYDFSRKALKNNNNKKKWWRQKKKEKSWTNYFNGYRHKIFRWNTWKFDSIEQWNDFMSLLNGF